MTRDEIIEALERDHRDSTAYWNRFPTTTFFEPLGDAWSPSDNLRHLTKSSRPLAKALAVPRLALWFRFGRSKRPSTSFEEVRDLYRSKLAVTDLSNNPFGPSKRDEPDREAWRARLMRERDEVHASLIAAIRRWSEKALDRYQLPHPLLGMMPVRDLLYFTLYHEQHHREVVERRTSALR